MFALGATYGYSYPELLPMSCPWEGLRQESCNFLAGRPLGRGVDQYRNGLWVLIVCDP